MEEKLRDIESLLQADKGNEAKAAFLELPETETVAYFLLKGKIERKFQNWGQAINAFNKVLELDSDNEEAKHNLQMIQSILDFWNPDLYNP